jgi:glucokinase
MQNKPLPLAEAVRPLYAGVDLGGTNIKSGLVDDLGRTLAFHTEPTHAARGPEDTAARMGQSVHALCRLVGIAPDDVARVGLGTPGPQDLPTGVIIRAGNLPGWDGFPIRDRVALHCGRPVTFANDANAAAYGEFWMGSAREFSSLVLLTLGTGVGGGIIIGDTNVEGAHSHGSECGHIIVDTSDTARMCPCGQPGHLEAYSSATAIKARAAEAVARDTSSRLARAVAAGEELTPLLVAREAEAGDHVSMDLILDAARWLGIGIVTLMHTIDPEAVVIGGAMTFGGEAAPVGKAFLDRVRQEVRSRTFPTLAEKTIIRYASLGGDAGYIGAAGLARLAHRAAS